MDFASFSLGLESPEQQIEWARKLTTQAAREGHSFGFVVQYPQAQREPITQKPVRALGSLQRVRATSVLATLNPAVNLTVEDCQGEVRGKGGDWKFCISLRDAELIASRHTICCRGATVTLMLPMNCCNCQSKIVPVVVPLLKFNPAQGLLRIA